MVLAFFLAHPKIPKKWTHPKSLRYPHAKASEYQYCHHHHDHLVLSLLLRPMVDPGRPWIQRFRKNSTLWRDFDP
jgi:hypothetical protein